MSFQRKIDNRNVEIDVCGFSCMVLQGRTWMKGLKDACGSNLKRPKFIRKPKSREGSQQDLAETLPLDSDMAEFAGSPPEPKLGDIPDPTSPPTEVLAGITKHLRENPPEALDPRSQRKKQFKAKLKGNAGVMSFEDL